MWRLHGVRDYGPKRNDHPSGQFEKISLFFSVKEKFFVYRSLLKLRLAVFVFTNTVEFDWPSGGVRMRGFYHFYYFWEKKCWSATERKAERERKLGWRVVFTTPNSRKLLEFFQFQSHSTSRLSTSKTHFPHTFYTQKSNFLFWEKWKKKFHVVDGLWVGGGKTEGCCAFLSYICTARKMKKIFFLRIFHN